LLKSPKKFLVAGDCITIKNSINTKKLNNKYTKVNSFLSFLEVDYYTNSIVIIKNTKEMNYFDINLSRDEYLDAKKYFFFI
jgi:hypothetical protein